MPNVQIEMCVFVDRRSEILLQDNIGKQDRYGIMVRIGITAMGQR